MVTTDKRKRSLYFPDGILREMQSEAKRQERSLSWIVQYAWRLARTDLMRLPSVGSSQYRDSVEHDEDHGDELEHEHESEHGPHHGEIEGTRPLHHHGS